MNFDNPPEWARTWCYIFFIGAILTFVTAAAVLYKQATKLGVWGVTVLMLLVSAQAATQMTYFWMCRRSLA